MPVLSTHGYARLLQVIVAGIVLVLAASTLRFSTSMVSAQRAPCSAPEPGAPMRVTADCVDPRFNDPYVDIDEQRTIPVSHRYIHGGFKGTDARFAFYFPSSAQYRGRFFQITHQLLTSENASPDAIGFALASGGYFVQTNLGGAEHATTTEQAVFGKLDPGIGGYRVNAEAAKYSRVKAAEIYGIGRPYGYLYGGSGGAFQTVSSAENTTGVWDGYLPYVMGSPNAIPSVFTARIHALRILKDKFSSVRDAVEPGGSGKPYAGLNDEEKEALREATRLGIPLGGWWNYETLNGGPLGLVSGYVPYLDPTYVEDFWTKPGYLGTDPASSVTKARIQYETSVMSVIRDAPKRIELSNVPVDDLTGSEMIVLTGDAAGKSVPLGVVTGTTAGFGPGANPAVVNGIQTGDKVRIDNSSYLALQTYHRHQLPSRDMYAWDQFRNSKGEPMYPQRDVLIGPISAFNAAGSIQNGRYTGKMIVMESLLDVDALPWQADWYRSKVKEARGDRLDEDFRLYFMDHAQHTAPVGNAALGHTVSYQGALEQALRDLAVWVEKGLRPPASTNYKIVDSQVEVPNTAAQRLGLQPVIRLTADSRDRIEVKSGKSVRLIAEIQVPPSGGMVVAAEWDYEGTGVYIDIGSLRDFRTTITVKSRHTFSRPGTFFPALRVTLQREGDLKTPYTRVQNLGRVRVVVK